MGHRALYAAAALLFVPALGAAPVSAQDNQTLEQRVQRIEDETAIRRLIMDYAVFLDARRFDDYVGLFAENGVWKNGPTVKTGRAEIRAMLVGTYGEPKADYVNLDSYRIVHNIEVELHGDHATAKSRQLTIMRGEGGSPTPRLSGIYTDELVRENGEWKFLKRTDQIFMPSAAEWGKQMAELRAAQQAAAGESK
jgi:hypothetical protein